MAQASDSVWLPVLPSMKDFGPALIRGAGKDADKAGSSVGKRFGTAIAAGVAGTVAGVGAAGAALYKVGEVFDDVADTIRVGTGATGEALNGLVDTAKNVGTKVPADFEKIGTVVADLNTRLGLSGGTLETVASQYLEAGRILGEEVDVAKTSAAFSAFKIEGEGVVGAMDHLFQVSQATGVGMNELADAAARNAPAMEILGFSFEETTAMIGSFDKAGLNSSALMASMSKGMVTLAKDGEEPAAAFKRVQEEITGFVAAGDDAAALELASKVFGTKGASQFIGAVKSGALNLEDMSKAAGQTEDSILGVGAETMDFAEQWQMFKNNVLVWLEPMGARVFGALGTLMGEVTDGVKAFGAAWKANNGDVTSSGIPGMMERIANSLKPLRDLANGLWAGFTLPTEDVAAFGDQLNPVLAFGVKIREVFDSVKNLATGVWAGFQMPPEMVAQFGDNLNPVLAFGAKVRETLGKMGSAFGQLGAPILGLLLALSPLQLLFTALLPVLPNLVGLVESVTVVATTLAGVVAGVLTAALTVMIPIIVSVVEWVAGLVVGLTDSQAKLDLLTGVLVAGAAAFVAYKAVVLGTSAVTKVHTAITKAHTLATKAAAVGQRLLNAAMKANPIGLIIAGITALVAGLVWFFTKTETGQRVVSAAWAGIKSAVSVVVDWFQSTVMPVLTAVWDGISAGAMWLWNNGIKPAWDGIMAAVRVVADWFQNTLAPAIKTVFDGIGAVFTWLYENIVKPVFDLISWYVGVWWTIVSGIFQVVVAVVQNVLAPIFTWLWESIIKPVFGWIGDLIATWWEGVKIVFNALVGFFRDIVAPIFTWLYEGVIKPVFAFISTVVSLWWMGVKIIFNAVVSFLRDTLGVAFTWLRDTIITPVWNGIKSIISSVWNNGIKPVFDALMGFVRNDLPAAFEAAKDGIGKAWDKVRDIAKKPVEFVVNKVINDGLIDTFNKIPGVDIKRVSLPKGFARGGIIPGYESRKRDTTLTPMRAGEGVLVPEAVRGMGAATIHALNKAGNTGGVHAVRKMVHGAAATAGEGNMGGFFEGNAAAIRRHGAYYLNVPASMAPWNFAGAARMWDGAAGVKVAIGRGSQQGYASQLERGGGILGYTMGNNIDMSPSWMRQLGATERRTVAAHEMGHALGLPHNSRNSIMQPNLANMASSPTAVDIRNLQSLYPGGSGKAGSGAVDNPFDGLLNKLMGQFKSAFPGGGMFVDAAGGLAKTGIQQVIKVVEDIKNGLKDLADNVFGKVKDFFGGAAATASPSMPSPFLHDQGGYLQPGLSSLLNKTRKPEPVLNTQQWSDIHTLAMRGAAGATEGAAGMKVEFNGPVYGNPEHIVSEMRTQQQRAISRHNVRKVM